MTNPSPDNPATDPATGDAAPSVTRHAKRPRRWWRRTKWTIRLAVGIPLLLLTVVLLLMRSPIVGRIVGGQVEKITGGQWRADHAAIMLNGQLIVTELGLRVPGVDGPGGQLLTAKQAVIDVDWWQLPPLKWVSSNAAGPVVRAVRLAEPAFRLSQSTDDDTLNIGKLKPAPSTGGGAAELPRIDVIDGRVEFTEHSPATGRFDELAVIPIAGALTPSNDGRPAFAVRLQEIGRAPAVSGERRGMVLDGRVDLASGESSLKLLNISLDAWPAESVPSRFRDLWRRLAVQGAVRQTVFTYSQPIGLKVSVVLDEVALTVPVPAERPGDEDGYLSLRKVDGEIGLSTAGLSADLTGMIEQQPGRSQVKLRTRGLDVDSGFRCEITGRDMSVAREPEFLPYVPAIVLEYLNMFGGPTGVIDAKVVIARADPVNGQAAPVTVPEGRLTLRNGSAAFHKFPYPFHDLTGDVTFDDQTIRIVRVEGVGHLGAKLTATALISPLTSDAMADVKVDVENVTVDDELLAAMPPSYRRLVEVLFARERYEELLAAGLVREPVDRERGGSDTAGGAGAGAGGGPPEFEFGGRARVSVHIERPEGKDADWSTKIGVRFATAGLVPEPFAFPIVARDLAIDIDDDLAELKSGRFTGLHGGIADVAAKIHFAESAAAEVEPDVRISARDVPVDELLLNAVPGEESEDGSASGSQATLNAKSILRRLDIRGRVDCSVTLSASKDRTVLADLVGPLELPPVAYEVEVELGSLTAAPATALAGGVDSGLCIRELSGAVVVTDSGVRIDGLSAKLGRMSADRPASDSYAQSEPAGEITLRLDAETLRESSAEQGRLHAEIELAGLDLSDRIEPAVGVFSTEAAAFLEGVRATRKPAGVVDAIVTLDSARGLPGTPVQIGVEVGRTSGLSLRALGGEVSLEEPKGVVRVTTADRIEPSIVRGERVDLEGVAGRLAFNGALAGAFTAAGQFTRDPVSGRLTSGDRLAFRLDEWRFEGGLTQAILAEFGGEAVSEGYQGLAPQGVFDAEVDLAAHGEALALNGWIEPRSLQITRRGQVVDFLKIGGRVNIRGEDVAAASGATNSRGVGGTIDNALVVTDEWSAFGGGTWSYRAPSDLDPGGVRLEASFDGTVREVGPQLRTLLPEAVLRGIDRLSLSFTEPVQMRGWQIGAELSGTESGPEDRVWLDGTAEFSDLSAELGVSLRDAAGRLEIDLGRAQSGSSAAREDGSFTLRFAGPSVKLAGVELTDFAAELARVRPGEVVLRDAAAACHGGRVMAQGSAMWDAESRESDPPVTFRLSTLIAGVNFAPLLDELGAAGVQGVAAAEQEGQGPVRSPVSSSDATRGTVDAQISMEAIDGQPESRIGRGAIRIAKGDVLRLPLILPLMQVSNLLLPLNDRLDYLQATFYLDGRRAVFDDVSVLSDSIAIVGRGSITMPNMDLDMRFNTKSNRRIPLWSDLFEAVRDEIASTTVTGTVGDPQVRSEPLTTTRRMLGDVMGSGERAAEKPPGESARRERERLQGRGG